MSLEQAFQSLEENIKTLITVLQSGGVMTAAAATTAPAADATPAPAVAEKKVKEPAKPKEVTKPAELSFKTVVEKITEMSKLTSAGRGRDGVKALLAHFTGKTEGVRVPDLEPLGKHAEILAATQKLIDTGALTEAVGDDDLGL